MPVFGAHSRKKFARWLQLAFYVALSITLMVASNRGARLSALRSDLNVVALPLRFIAAFPDEAFQNSARYLERNASLQRSNRILRAQDRRLRARVERYRALEAENTHLRKLLGAAPRAADRAVAATILANGSAPFSRIITLDRGTAAGIYVRQPVIDDHGLMGQVLEVSRYSSQAILITDPNQAVPVEDLRSGQRAIIMGTGAADRVNVPYLTPSADIRPGDLLISSGLGGVFPPGYPVARVMTVRNNPNEAFLKVSARPAAHLNRGRQVLLIWPKGVRTMGARR
ncbi:MAG: rod shape-determining protein MreC [Acidiferrobacteraceae bacterium]